MMAFCVFLLWVVNIYKREFCYQMKYYFGGCFRELWHNRKWITRRTSFFILKRVICSKGPFKKYVQTLDRKLRKFMNFFGRFSWATLKAFLIFGTIESKLNISAHRIPNNISAHLQLISKDQFQYQKTNTQWTIIKYSIFYPSLCINPNKKKLIPNPKLKISIMRF